MVRYNRIPLLLICRPVYLRRQGNMWNNLPTGVQVNQLTFFKLPEGLNIGIVLFKKNMIRKTLIRSILFVPFGHNIVIRDCHVWGQISSHACA